MKKIFDWVLRMFGITPKPPPVVPPVEPPKPPEGHEIETIKVNGDGLWKPDTLTYLLPTNQRKVAPAPGWSANGAAISPHHIARAGVWRADGSFRGWLLWPGKTKYGGKEVDGTTTITADEITESNWFKPWVKLHKARAESGSVIKVFDIFGQQICELPVPDGAKRAEGRR